MDMKTRTIFLWSGVAILVVAGIVTLFLSFGGSKDTAVDEVNVIYTNAASTVAAQQQTLQAGMLSATPNPTLGSPTATLTPLPTPTVQQRTPAPLPTFAPSTGVVTGCDLAVYVSDVTIPDGTTIAAGQSFTKTWKISNKGSCAWMATYQLIFISGDSLGGKATAIGKVVNPGETADISVILTSSSAAGSIKGTWKMANEKAQPFGDALTVVINSGTTTGTVTQTRTPIPTGSFTATPTKSPTPIVIVITATYTPTSASTPTPTPTPTSAVPTNTPVPTDTPTPTPTYTPSG